jgi:hypothetical protein
MRKYLKYIGDSYILGEIIGESHDRFYWKVRTKPTRKQPKQKIILHPKWSTEVINEDDLLGF